MTRPPWLSKPEWANIARWLTANRAKGLDGTLKLYKQERFNRYYPHSQHYRDNNTPEQQSA